MLHVTLKRSRIGRSREQKEALRCLGLKKTHQTRILAENACVRGQLKKVLHLVEIQEKGDQK